MGIFHKKRIKEYDPDTPGPMRQLLDRIPPEPESMLHVSLTLTVDELVLFGKVMQEVKKKANEGEVGKGETDGEEKPLS
jgi:hypothetical protein